MTETEKVIEGLGYGDKVRTRNGHVGEIVSVTHGTFDSLDKGAWVRIPDANGPVERWYRIDELEAVK